MSWVFFVTLRNITMIMTKLISDNKISAENANFKFFLFVEKMGLFTAFI